MRGRLRGLALVATLAVGCRGVLGIDDGELFDGGVSTGQDATIEGSSQDGTAGEVGADAPPSDVSMGGDMAGESGTGTDASGDEGVDASGESATGTDASGDGGADASGDSATGTDASRDGAMDSTMDVVSDVVSEDSPVDSGTGDGSDGSVVATGFTAVTGGYTFTCGLLSGGTVECWGFNQQGQVDYALDASVPVTTPVPVPGVSGATAIATGSAHVCAIVAGGAVTCWGDNTYGQLGNGSDGGSNVPPGVVSGLGGVTALTAGYDHTCAITSGTVKCWGWNQYGQLGDGTGNDSTMPVSVTLPKPATAVVAGSQHTCALLSDGTVECWGDNYFGDLGMGGPGPSGGIPPVEPAEPSPVPVVGITDSGTLGGIVAIAAGGNFNCALASGGTAYCWGQGSNGELGNGSTNNSATPGPVSGSLSVVAFASGSADTLCALLSGGTVSCWGSGITGQLGNGSSPLRSPTPGLVKNPQGTGPLTGVVAVGAAYVHGCAIVGGGALYCWGDDTEGELGNGVTNQFPVTLPVAVQ